MILYNCIDLNPNDESKISICDFLKIGKQLNITQEVKNLLCCFFTKQGNKNGLFFNVLILSHQENRL